MDIKLDNDLFNDEEKRNTPMRYKRFMAEWQRRRRSFKFSMFKNPGYNQMVILRNYRFASLCAHHLLPFHGTAHVGYIPRDKICGISKLGRTVDMFASRPQTQEQLTEEVAKFLAEKLKPQGLMIVLEAAHDCMRIRGVRSPDCSMVTSAIRGAFTNQETRMEFLNLVRCSP